MGLGMAALGRPGYINLDRNLVFGVSNSRSIQDMQGRANRVLDALFQQEKRPWVDCARSYGLSEKFVGEYLRNNNIAPEDVYVSSKWGYCECSAVQCNTVKTCFPNGFCDSFSFHFSSLNLAFVFFCIPHYSLCCRLEGTTRRWETARSQGPFRRGTLAALFSSLL